MLQSVPESERMEIRNKAHLIWTWIKSCFAISNRLLLEYLGCNDFVKNARELYDWKLEMQRVSS